MPATAKSHQTATRKPTRELQFYKCDYCRRDKKKCLPTDRQHPQKCQRCLEKGLPCSRPVRSESSKRHHGPEVAEQLATPDPASQPAPYVHPYTTWYPDSGQEILEPDTEENHYADNHHAILSRAYSQPVEGSDAYDMGHPDADMVTVGETPTIAAPPTFPIDDSESGAYNSNRTSSAPGRRGTSSSGRRARRATPLRQHRSRPAVDQTSDGNANTDIPFDDPNDEFDVPRFLACPFYKFDPARHFRCYRKYEMRRYSDVKQHILRCHTLGALYCSRCWASFKTNRENDWMDHVQRLDCERQPLPENLLPNEVRSLDALEFGASPTDDWKWYMAWDLLFPGQPRPSSPYVDPGYPEFLNLLNPSLAALQERLPTLLDAQGVGLDPEAIGALVRQIHGIYATGPGTKTVKRRLQARIDASESDNLNK